MKISYELDLQNFKAWSGAVDTLDKIILANKCSEVENLLEECYPDGMDETALNDLLWFESDWIFESVGLNEDGEIPHDDSDMPVDEFVNCFDEFTDLCSGRDCKNCPLWNVKGDCETNYKEIRENGLKNLEI